MASSLHPRQPGPCSATFYLALQICVADGRTDTDGTLYANPCALKNCVYAAWLTDSTPRYNYLPLDCGSAVACSLMGHAVGRCRKVWLGQTTTSVLTDDSCSCGLKRECGGVPAPPERSLDQACQLGASAPWATARQR